MIRLTTKLAPAPLALLLVASVAVAQQSVIEHCRNTSSDTDRIACLEAALLGRDYAIAAPAAVPQIDPPNTEIDAGVIDASTVESAELPPEADSSPVGIGSEQVISRAQIRKEGDKALESAVGLAVARYHHVPYERLVVTLENGQVWRQIKGDTTRIRVNLDRNQTVNISKSALGGYKLQLNEMRRTVRVERIQ